MEIPLSYFLVLSAILFSIGIAIVIVKRHIIVILMGIELMLNAVNINLIAFSRNDPGLQGQSMSLFVLVVAAAEAVVVLAIVLLAYKHFKSVNMDDFSEMNG
ncbi:MAG: NADH-quinone oxidoreductase subunit NuoK [Bacteroidota bacterium]